MLQSVKPEPDPPRPISPAPPPASVNVYDIFISLRFCEALHEGKALKKQLEEQHLRVFLCEVLEGLDLGDTITDALHHSSLVVILGTATYGRPTTSPYSTLQELKFVVDEKKPFYLVKMCEEFLENAAKFHLTRSVAYYSWSPTTAQRHEEVDVPKELIDRIVKRYLQARPR